MYSIQSPKALCARSRTGAWLERICIEIIPAAEAFDISPAGIATRRVTISERCMTKASPWRLPAAHATG
jgi:hypothetical protein